MLRILKGVGCRRRYILRRYIQRQRISERWEAALARERAIADYSCCITTSMTALAPFSTVMTLWTGEYPVSVMSTT